MELTLEQAEKIIRSESRESLFYKAFIKFLKSRIDDELTTALDGNQADSARAFNNGRASAMIDLVGILDELTQVEEQ